MYLSKDVEGGAGPYYWSTPDELIEVPDVFGLGLIRDNHLGFHAHDYTPPKEQKAPKQKLAPKEENPIGSIKEALEVTRGK